MELFKKFLQVLNALERENVDYILVGGFAVILYGLPRLTEDIDIFINFDEDNIIKLKKALLSVFNDNSINDITPDMLKNYPVIRYGSPDGFYIDILCNLGEAFTYSDLKYEIHSIDGQSVRIATAETLYDMKKDTVRPTDKEDSVFLKKLIDNNGKE